VTIEKMKVDPGFRETTFTEEEWPHEYYDYRGAWDYFPREGIEHVAPLHLDIELTNRCNLRCPFCIREYMEGSIGDMDPQIFHLVMADIVQYAIPSVKLNWRGEPTLHPLLPRYIKNLKEEGGVLEVAINTNGVAVNKDLAEQLVSSGLDRIIWSIDSIEPDIYERMKVGADLVDVVNNLKGFIKARGENKRPYIRVQKIDLPETRDEDYIEFFRKLKVDSVAINTYKEKDEGKVRWEPLPCAQPYQRMVLSWDGFWYPCCQGHNFPSIGNIEDMPLRDAWHSPLMSNLREAHAKGHQSRFKQCRTCETTKPEE
jgi:pyruvate-formate lyase-activating enzyme